MKRSRESYSVSLASGETLRGDISYNGSPSGMAIVYVHGLGSFRGGEKSQALEDACAERGLCFSAFDFRGHGQSDGSLSDLTGSRLLEDLAAIRHYLMGRGIRRLGLVGSSMGGWASAWFGLQAGEVTRCVLLAPAFRFLQRRWESLTPEQQEDWKNQGSHLFTGQWVDAELKYAFAEERYAFSPTALAFRWQKPMLILHGLADDVVPVSDSWDFLNSCPYPHLQLRVFKNGDHRLTQFKAEIGQEACRFLSE
ncbi:alpha/beta fold hydrolase [Telmatocola sphagniphila]|uniref:Palmitoyl-protein thioesterase ABHD10, mitochondrial n=1 Tax=Telmatocola sphagniphila TaxID=1123043 RepID=A0A8E6B461_9BACT|nr:alpha/beta fold hydrolase [Telmatocola sphagniphila]QVL31845.1 alpha/beta fold hydrolase [Telmatocola sphagniphila]